MSGSIWPGFVDAMTALLLVLMFVLTIFMIVQGVLREQISGQESELDQLAAEVTSLSTALGLSQQQSARLEDNLANLRSESDRQASLIANLMDRGRMPGLIAAQQGRIETAFLQPQPDDRAA